MTSKYDSVKNVLSGPSYSDLPRNSDAFTCFSKKGPNRELNPGPLPVLRAPLRVSKFSRREYNTTILLGRSVKDNGPIELLIQITHLVSVLATTRMPAVPILWKYALLIIYHNARRSARCAREMRLFIPHVAFLRSLSASRA